MKKLLAIVVLIICLVVMVACDAEQGIIKAFDLSQYSSYQSIITVSKNGGVIIEEVVTVTSKDTDTYLETTATKTLAPIDSDAQYIEVTDTKEYKKAEYAPTTKMDLTLLTVPQLSSIVTVDGVRKLSLNLTTQELAVLLKEEVAEGITDIVLTVILDEKEDILKSATLTYLSVRGNNISISITATIDTQA